jgi:prepilin-type processing-associated H-X9-DG protein/prepilin-type N-terminal cleavage/methylation domain-containing protein
MKKRKKSTIVYFTLLELLIVIAIIAILTSMLLPALRRANAVSKKIACTSNMKQVFVGNFNYASDNNGYIPPSCGIQNGGFIVPYSKYWSDVIVYQGYLEVPVVNAYGALDGVPPSGVMLCPGETRRNYVGGTEWLSWLGTHFGQGYSISYSYDEDGIIVDAHVRWLRFSAIPKPSEICFLGDKNMSDETTRSYKLNPYLLLETVSFRHSGGANFVFSDGHSDWIKFDDFPQDKKDVFWGFKCFRSYWE